uniref:receptor protein-tyrosine kinase n=1 Tax=Macrostomum lignano TaxID=282301 RepID=A0A1I8JKI8_9PLAT
MTINVTGCYRVKTAGAKGGDSFGRDQKHGGRGALIAGNVILAAGTQLSIVVGQAGGTAHTDEYASGGGGGGSFVYRTLDNGLLMAAGGGGGASYKYDGQPGEAGNNGTGSVGTEDPNQMGTGGINGNRAATTKALRLKIETLVAVEPAGLAGPPSPAHAKSTETEAAVAPTAGSAAALEKAA